MNKIMVSSVPGVILVCFTFLALIQEFIRKKEPCKREGSGPGRETVEISAFSSSPVASPVPGYKSDQWTHNRVIGIASVLSTVSLFYGCVYHMTSFICWPSMFPLPLILKTVILTMCITQYASPSAGQTAHTS